MSKTSFEKKIVWLTGASSGIGKALASAFSKKGALLVLSSRNVEKLEQVKSQCVNKDKHLVIPLDLTDSTMFPQAVTQVINRFEHIDILVHCGGITQRALAQETSLEVDRQIMETNYFGYVALTKAVLPSLLGKKSGHIVVISSISGKFGVPLRSAYCASKHALHGFFDSLRTELLDSGIKVTIVCPGFIKTDISLNALTGDGKPYEKMDQAQLNGMLPEDCAQKILEAIAKDQQEVLIGGSEIVAVYLKRFFPPLFNRIISNAKVT